MIRVKVKLIWSDDSGNKLEICSHRISGTGTKRCGIEQEDQGTHHNYAPQRLNT